MEIPLRTSSQEEDECSVLRPGLLNPREIAPCNFWIWAWLGPIVRLNAVFQKIVP